MFWSEYVDYLTKILFKVVVPDIATRNPRHVQLWGLEVPEDEKEAKVLRKKKALVGWCIADILEYIEKGIYIEIYDRKDIPIMCEYITGYLRDYKAYLALNPDERVSDNLRLVTGLEKLSKDLYSRLLPEEVVQPVKQKGINGIGIRFVNPMAMMKNDEPVVPVKPTYEEKYGGSITHLLRMHLEREKR